MKQLDMFPAPPYQRHSATSAAAAAAIAPHLNPLQGRVLGAIRHASHGLTDEAIGHVTDLPGNTVRPRRIELLRKGLIRDSGKTRATASGRQAVVWELIGS